MSEAKWYVVHTYSGYENKVKANIEKTIENRHLEDQILEVRVPLQEVVEMKNGAAKQVQKKMFPGYVLINMIMNDDTWYVVRNTRGVTGFVGPGSKPVPLTEEEMKPLGIREETVQVDFAEGDPAVTHFERLAVSHDHSLLEIHLETGRTHQIRVHMGYLGYPLPADYLYCPDYSRFSRQPLHSFQLVFTRPVTGAPLCVTAPVPSDIWERF